MTQACLFCRISAQEIPATVVYEDEDVIAIKDINPQAPVHVLLMPRRHFTDLPELMASGESPLAAHLLKVATQLANSQGMLPAGFRMVVNTGAHGGQSVAHLHLHLLGGRPLAWPPG